MSRDYKFENLIHEARMLSIKGQYSESLKSYHCDQYLICRYQNAINSLIDTMSDLEEGEKTRLQATLHMYLEEADAVKSVMNGESNGNDLQQDLEQKTDSFRTKESKMESITFSDIGNSFLTAVNEVGHNVWLPFTLSCSCEKLISDIRLLKLAGQWPIKW